MVDFVIWVLFEIDRILLGFCVGFLLDVIDEIVMVLGVCCLVECLVWLLIDVGFIEVWLDVVSFFFV